MKPRDARNEAGSLTQRLIVVYVHVSKMNNINQEDGKLQWIQFTTQGASWSLQVISLLKFYQIIFDVCLDPANVRKFERTFLNSILRRKHKSKGIYRAI